MYLIDTNIFLEVLLNQERADECESFLKSIDKSKDSFYVSSFTLHSIEVIMARNNKTEALESFLSFITRSKIIRVDTVTSDESTAVKDMKEFQIDFDDSIQLAVCKKYSLSIVSFDKHFDKTQVKRLEPGQVSF
ncbi:type II toxin-antitoxin system VapC family toxin [Candidatus Pacearchaeota archaeon]|nr:type II toxin-antitoxin system VapC family toxin [Candidatus Pacearchaeota archaeon]